VSDLLGVSETNERRGGEEEERKGKERTWRSKQATTSTPNTPTPTDKWTGKRE